ALLVAAVAATARADDKGKILLTGFEPFEGPKNPSWEAVKGLNGKVVDGYQVVAVELPVEWKRGAERLEEALRDQRPVWLRQQDGRRQQRGQNSSQTRKSPADFMRAARPVA